MSPPVGLQHRSAAAPADRPSVDRGVVVDEQYVLLALVCPHELDRLAVNECLCQLGQIYSVYAQYKVCISSTMRTQKPPHKASCTELHRLHRLHRQACCSSAPWRSLLSTLPSAMVTLLHMRRAGGTALHHLWMSPRRRPCMRCVCSAHDHAHVHLMCMCISCACYGPAAAVKTREGRFWPRGGTSSPPCVGGAGASAAAAS